ncbi:MAG: hypothetical protein H0W88_07560 [Parachlamydiaceae bacterium]|nr:hypothetical protein [Parachlamydiaceae bacterium]
MTALERRALYNLLRIHSLNDPQLAVEEWQVEDYRILPIAKLFERLGSFSIHLDKISFVAYADECDSPEDLTEHLLGDRPIDAQVEDQVYLLIFELWRRLVNEKPSLSIICNELDYYIYLYDSEQLETPIALQDAIANFLTALNENVDAGIEPKEAFQLVSNYCANDIETFLYDFISDQIDAEHESYAHDLLDSTATYIEGNKWFLLLRARVLNQSNQKLATRQLLQLTEDHLDDKDLEFHMELLAFMAEAGTPNLFRELIAHTAPLLLSEEDFQDLLIICIDYYHRLDQEQQEQKIQKIFNKRSKISLIDQFDINEPDLALFLTIIKS